jgi:integrase
VDLFGTKPIRKIRADDIRVFQKLRLEAGEATQTINMEMKILRLMLKRANTPAETAGGHPEGSDARAKRALFRVASEKPEWKVAYCAAVLAVSTTSRGIELNELRWSDVDFAHEILFIRCGKTMAGHRTIPLNEDAVLALTQLRQRAEILGSDQEQHCVVPTCENHQVDPTKPQRSWRSAWRTFTRAAAV